MTTQTIYQIYNRQKLNHLLEQIDFSHPAIALINKATFRDGIAIAGTLALEFEDREKAKALYDHHADLYRAVARTDDLDELQLWWPSCMNPLCISPPPDFDGWDSGYRGISSNASDSEVHNFITEMSNAPWRDSLGQTHYGKIATILVTQTGYFLRVNRQQAAIRGGNLTTGDWTRINAMQLWMPNFNPGGIGGINYYEKMMRHLGRDRRIENFEYCILSPPSRHQPQELRRYWSNVYWVDGNTSDGFEGNGPIRIMVSHPEAQETIEVYN